MTISQSILPEFEDEMKKTRALLERVPEDKFDYTPHAKSMSLGRLATHVAELASWAQTTLTTELLEIPGDYKPHLAATREELLHTFDKGVTEARSAIQAASDEDWRKTWTCTYGGQTIISAPRTEVMRGPVLNHLIHHRAQLGVYLRLNNVAIPGMYGPSADEMESFQTQTAA